jgi:hypothetical protein
MRIPSDSRGGLTVHAKWPTIAWISIWLGCLAAAPVARAQESEADAAALEASARAQVAAGDLAASLRSVEGSLRSSEPIAAAPETLTKEDNDRLIESAVKDQLAQTADELDQLSAALAAGADPELTKALVESLSRRAASLSQLGSRTDQPLIPTEQLEALRQLWSEVQALSVTDSTIADTESR